MTNKSAISLSEKEEVLDRNEMINRETIVAHQKLEKKLKKLGVEIKPRFNVEPPLGTDRTGCHNENVKHQASNAFDAQ